MRNLISENDLSAADIPDQDGDGRITKEDVVNFLDKNPQAKKPEPETTPEEANAEKPEIQNHRHQTSLKPRHYQRQPWMTEVKKG